MNILRRIILLKNFFLSFPDIEQKDFRLFFGNFSDGFVKSAFFVSIKTFSSKRFSFKNKIFLIFFGFCVTIFCLLVEKVDGVFKSTFYFSIGTLWAKLFPLEKISFLIIVGQCANIFRHFVEKIPKASSKLRSTSPKRTLCWKKGLEENFFVTCGQWTKNCRLFVKKDFSRVVKTAFCASIGKFWGEIFWKEYFFSISYIQEKKLQVFWRNFRQFCWNSVFFVSMRTFWGKGVFSGKYSYLFWLLGDELLSVCWEKKRWSYKNCLLRVQMNILRRIILLKNFFLSFPDIEQKDFRLFFGNFPDGFIKTAFFVSMKTY